MADELKAGEIVEVFPDDGLVNDQLLAVDPRFNNVLFTISRGSTFSCWKQSGLRYFRFKLPEPKPAPVPVLTFGDLNVGDMFKAVCWCKTEPASIKVFNVGHYPKNASVAFALDHAEPVVRVPSKLVPVGINDPIKEGEILFKKGKAYQFNKEVERHFYDESGAVAKFLKLTTRTTKKQLVGVDWSDIKVGERYAYYKEADKQSISRGDVGIKSGLSSTIRSDDLLYAVVREVEAFEPIADLTTIKVGDAVYVDGKPIVISSIKRCMSVYDYAERKTVLMYDSNLFEDRLYRIVEDTTAKTATNTVNVTISYYKTI